jgi:hypothetical protein
MANPPPEYQRFLALAKKLVAVPRAELEKKLAEYRATPKKRGRRKPA